MSEWITAPISSTCEVWAPRPNRWGQNKFCHKPATHAYPAVNVGWMSLCHEHAKQHPEAMLITELIEKGETLK